MWTVWKTYAHYRWITNLSLGVMWKTYPQMMCIIYGNAHNVGNVENLSTCNVHNNGTRHTMWTMWKTYPHRLWITNINLLVVDNVENLSTLPVHKYERVI